jgi:hypothetical protein
MAQDSRAWISFHLFSVPFLAAAAAAGYGLLFALNGPGA